MVKFKRPDAIQEMMIKAVKSLPDAASIFADLVAAAPESRPVVMDRLHEVEVKADKRYVALLEKVTSTFVTPYDREDIYSMIETVDDVIDQLDHTGSLIVSLNMGELPAQYIENAQHLLAMAEACAGAPELIKKPKKLESLLYEVNAMENKLDEGYRALLTDCLQPDADPIQAIRIKMLADNVEEAAHRLEEFVYTLGITAIKET